MFKFTVSVLILNILCHNLVSSVSLDEDQIKIFTKEKFLQLFGLSKQPISLERSDEEKRSASSYLMNIYSKTVDELSSLNYTNYHLTEYDFKKVNDSDTIASFMAQEPNEGRGGKPSKIQRMWFDVLLINEDQQILSTDLRLYRDTSKTIDEYHGLSFNMTVYRTDLTGDKKNLVYVNSIIVDADFNGWIILDITVCFKWWTDNINMNNGLEITVTPISRASLIKRLYQVTPEQIGIVGFDGDTDKHAFAVGYYRSLQQRPMVYEVSNVIERHPRSMNIHDYNYEDKYLDEKLMTPLDKQMYRYRKLRCNLRKMNLKFVDLGLDFIVAPTMIDLNDCVGKCRAPFAYCANATTHAILKSALGFSGQSRLNTPNCIPISYAERKLLFYASNKVLLFARLRDVTATACGCR